MKPLFNEQPKISYQTDDNEHKSTIAEGYASHILAKDNATVLCFKDVDDHIDGNGKAVLWLIKGTGKFYYDGECTELKVGDVMIFNDNIEHGFESDELCVGVNFVINEEYSLDDIKNMVKNFNSVKPTFKP